VAEIVEHVQVQLWPQGDSYEIPRGQRVTFGRVRDCAIRIDGLPWISKVVGAVEVGFDLGTTVVVHSENNDVWIANDRGRYERLPAVERGSAGRRAGRSERLTGEEVVITIVPKDTSRDDGRPPPRGQDMIVRPPRSADGDRPGMVSVWRGGTPTERGGGKRRLVKAGTNAQHDALVAWCAPSMVGCALTRRIPTRRDLGRLCGLHENTARKHLDAIRAINGLLNWRNDELVEPAIQEGVVTLQDISNLDGLYDRVWRLGRPEERI